MRLGWRTDLSSSFRGELLFLVLCSPPEEESGEDVVRA